ncbi:class I SAM-dependent methyltransferase [Magnetospirillum fulvum]|uniref:Methyltransferase domain-containing protein n=1 Tax=Magnetospirillum fulvum TaxID=1082 RepID=A0A1H6H8J7_MAGFU|nr:class I SAM-dependent methyltransferase [Magnetospirillum fulvum]SEH30293.1 Methyltransferase domain-containing protein [Magnetospirillum fulvum]
MFGRQKSSAAVDAQKVRKAAYVEPAPRNPALCHSAPEGKTEWYPPVMIGAEAIGRQLTQSTKYVREALALIERLEPDAYSDYMKTFYKDGLERFGDDWGFADIVTVLLGLADLLKPRRYLEIGVRRGRSICAVASRSTAVDLAMFDMWVTNYAGMENPGQQLVERELDKVGHTGNRAFTDGNSHDTVPEFFRANPDLMFDMITVDGDHSEKGAIDDLCDVLPHLSVGGAIVFDDVCHPKHMSLRDVWQRVICDDKRFSAWTYDDVGYGVGFAIRKW